MVALFFVFFHDAFYFVKPFVPHFSKGLNKFGYFFHFFWIKVIINFPACLLLFKQFTLREYLQVF